MNANKHAQKRVNTHKHTQTCTSTHKNSHKHAQEKRVRAYVRLNWLVVKVPGDVIAGDVTSEAARHHNLLADVALHVEGRKDLHLGCQVAIDTKRHVIVTS